MVTKVLELTTDREKQIFWTLFGILLFCACFYIYSVNATVRNLVAHQNMEDEATGLSLSLGKQEFKYIEMRNAIDLAAAYSLGFKNVSNKTFVSNKSVSVISMNQGVPADSL